MKKEELNAEDKVPLNLSVTVADKQFLKIYAAKHNTNMSAMIHEYVERLRQEEDAD